MTTKTEEELRLEAEALAAKADVITEKIEEKNTWTPEQITKLMTQLSEIQAQQAAILEKLEAKEKSSTSIPPQSVPNVDVVDPLEAEKEAERLRLGKEANDKKNVKPPKHRAI